MSWQPSRGALIALKSLAHAALLVPFALLAYGVWRGDLGPDPVARITHETGIWAFRILLVTLAITPLRRLTGWTVLQRFRRLLGLYAFFYATLHFATYLVLDLGGFWTQIFEDIAKRPFITVGFIAWLLLVPLAATSTTWAMRKLKRNWARLHRAVYAIGALVALHFVWVRKSGELLSATEPAIYAGIFVLLMLARVPWSRLSASRARAA
jgi:sulfoxide reductase heme-binding subunit YedZ